MRVAVLVTIAATVLVALTATVAVAGFGLFDSKDRCELFQADLERAVTEPAKAPDPDDDASLTSGTCSVIATKTLDVRLPGWERHSERTVAGRLNVGGRDGGLLDRVRAGIAEDRGARITPLASLGRRAFLVTMSDPDRPQDQWVGTPSDPANGLPLPATAYWTNDDDIYMTVSANRAGATVAQAQRATERLAELVDRRSVEPMG